MIKVLTWNVDCWNHKDQLRDVGSCCTDDIGADVMLFQERDVRGALRCAPEVLE